MSGGGDGGGSKSKFVIPGSGEFFLGENVLFGDASCAHWYSSHPPGTLSPSIKRNGSGSPQQYLKSNNAGQIITKQAPSYNLKVGDDPKFTSLTSTIPVLHESHKLATTDPDPGDGGGSKWLLYGGSENDTIRLMLSTSPDLVTILALVLHEAHKLVTTDPDPGDGGGSKWSLHGGCFLPDMSMQIVM